MRRLFEPRMVVSGLHRAAAAPGLIVMVHFAALPEMARAQDYTTRCGPAAPAALGCRAEGSDTAVGTGTDGPLRLHLIPTAQRLMRGDFQVDVGQTTTLGGGVKGGGGGSGNQTYRVRTDLAPTDRISVAYFLEDNDDPTWGRIDGVRYDKELWLTGVGLRFRWDGWGPFSVMAEGSAAVLGLKSERGLFTDGPDLGRAWFSAGSLAGSIDWRFRPGWSATVSPAFVFLPWKTGGRRFFGSSMILGLGLRGRIAGPWVSFATGDFTLGPGWNHVDGRFRFRRVPVWTTGVIFAASRQVRVKGFLTGGAGGSPVTRHLTLLGGRPTQAGLRIHWLPRQPKGFMTAGPRWRGEVELALDQRRGRGLVASVGLADVLDLEVGLLATPGSLARNRLGLTLGDGSEFRLGGRVLLRSEDFGHAITAVARIAVGRSFETLQGYLVAETAISRQVSDEVGLCLTPMIALNGGSTPAGVEASLRVDVRQGTSAFLRSLILLPPHRTPHTIRLEQSLGAGTTGSIWLSTAQGPFGIARFLADGRHPRVGASMRWAW